jgi:translocation and assembly module TamB
MIGRAFAIFGIVVAFVLGAVLWYASTPQFASRVRNEVIEVLERSTGGRVDLGSFTWHLTKLEVEVDGLTIHGLEAPTEVPYAHIDKLLIRAKIISLFRAQIGLRLLQAEHPIFHLIIYPDGTTNQPTPKTEMKSTGKPVLDEVFDLAVDRLQIDNGLLILNQRKIPFNVAAQDLSAVVNYIYSNGHYNGSLSVADLTAQSGKAPSVHSKLDLNVDLARDEAKLTGLHFSSGDSTLEASANIKNFNDPHWQLAAKGAIDLREVASLLDVSGLGPGSAVLNISGQGVNETQFDINGNAALKDASYKSDSFLITGLNASTIVRVTQDEIVVPNLEVKLRQGGDINGSLQLLHWMAPTPPTTVTAAQKTTRPIATRGPAPQQQQAKIALKLRGIRVQTLLEMASAKKIADLGFDSALSGSANIGWTGTIAALTAETKLNLAPPSPPVNGQVPVTGLLDAAYVNHGGRLTVRDLNVHTQGTTLRVSGEAGVYPATGPAALNIDLALTNLAEFNRALIAAGVSANGKQGVAALPINLQGQAGFHGALTGSLLAPDLKGHISARQFSTLIPVAAAPAPKPKPQYVRTKRNGKTVVVVKDVPVIETPAAPAQTQSIQWDDLEADVEYSGAMVSVQQATLTRGKTAIHAAGQLHAHEIRKGKFAFDQSSAINATAQIQDANIPDLLSIAGQNVPVTGTLTLQAHAGGELGNLTGGGHLTVLGGTAYNQPYKSLNADLQLAGKQIVVPQFTFLAIGGKITGSGLYDTGSNTFRANATGANFQLADLQAMQAQKLHPQGDLSFDLHASGTVQNPVVNGTAKLDNIVAGGEKLGALQLRAHTTDGIIYFDAHANIVSAQLVLAGQVIPHNDYDAKAQLSLSHLDINPIMEMMGTTGVKGHSIIDGTINIAGPLKTPKALEGDARISQFSLGVQNLTLASQAPLHASLRAGIITLDPLKITGQDTSFTAQGTADILGEGDLDLDAAGSIDVKLAQLFNSEILSTGKIDFNVNAGGSIKQPDLSGQVKLTDVGVSYQEFPSGISQLNGTLVFSQNRLDFRDVTGVSGGGQVKVVGYLSYQQGIYGDIKLNATNVRFRYLGISTTADANIRLQGTQDNLLIGGNVLITRFVISPNVDFAALASAGAVAPPPNPNSFGNKLRLDVHITSSPQLDFQNSYAQLAGAVDLRIRGTVEQPSVLGNVTITEGTATFAGTTYQLEHGDVYFTNPVRIEPTIDLDAVTRVEQYDVTIGLHGTLANLQPTFRSEPPLPEADVVSLLALGRTQDEQSIYSQEQTAAGVNGTTDALLGGALNATVSSRIQKLFGVGSVKIDPTYQSALGDTSARITVSQNIGKSVTAMFATNVNTSAQQLIQAQWNLSENLSLTAVRDEANVFSLTFKIHRRYR